MLFDQVTIKQRIIKENANHIIYFHNLNSSDFKGLIYKRVYEN
jgi:hypothetical protein